MISAIFAQCGLVVHTYHNDSVQEFGFVTLASFRLCECYLFVRSRTKTRCGKFGRR